MCEPCREDRRVAKRARHAERRAAGLCVNCAVPAPDGKAYCDPCAKTRSRRRNLEAIVKLRAWRMPGSFEVRRKRLHHRLTK